MTGGMIERLTLRSTRLLPKQFYQAHVNVAGFSMVAGNVIAKFVSFVVYVVRDT